jgi:hypothetical protein
MQNVIKRVINRLFSELTNNFHLPQFGRVVAYTELPTESEKASDPFYPRYAANIQLLNEHGENAAIEVLESVPLPLPGAGDNAGRLEPPAINAIVEIAFAYGRADKPFIRAVLPFGFDLPEIKENETRTQTKTGVYQHIDENGNFEAKTDQSMKNIIGKLAELQCETRKVTASAEQEHKSPKTWLGSDSENVLKLLSELMATVSELANTCASHKHLGVTTGPGVTGVSDKAGDFTNQGSTVDGQKSRLDPITK